MFRVICPFCHLYTDLNFVSKYGKDAQDRDSRVTCNNCQKVFDLPIKETSELSTNERLDRIEYNVSKILEFMELKKETD